MGKEGVFGNNAEPPPPPQGGGGSSGSVLRNTGEPERQKAKAKAKNPDDTSSMARPDLAREAAMTGLRREAEEWKKREPPSSRQHKLVTRTSLDGQEVTIRMSDLKNQKSYTADGSVILNVQNYRRTAQVKVSGEEYLAMKKAYEVAEKSWLDNYQRWRHEGEFRGFVAGYDGAGKPAAKQLEF